ncbi:hypothetical protein DLM_3893 [Aquitalea magnusonii]|uniref:Uncharacterized protein n=1 Tax=Aquitalea magnusonii TaxID=332411 RepID=A0A3G9GP96_9NEIS|nr:hypothetical protein DLM_3893 [Aquitalea magnusonii]
MQDSRFAYFFDQTPPGTAVLAGGSTSWLLKARSESTLASKPVIQGKN